MGVGAWLAFPSSRAPQGQGEGPAQVRGVDGGPFCPCLTQGPALAGAW